MNVDQVKRVIGQYSELRATSSMRDAILYDHQYGNEPSALGRKIALVDSLLTILTEEERFVVSKHLIDGLPWPLVVVEYRLRWGRRMRRTREP